MSVSFLFLHASAVVEIKFNWLTYSISTFECNVFTILSQFLLNRTIVKHLFVEKQIEDLNEIQSIIFQNAISN